MYVPLYIESLIEYYINSQLTYTSMASVASDFSYETDCGPSEPVMSTINFSCDRTVDSITGLLTIHLNWTYEYNPLIEEAISRRNIFFKARTDEGDLLNGDNIPLDPQVYIILCSKTHHCYHYIIWECLLMCYFYRVLYLL